MSKTEFIAQLKSGLSGFPQDDIEELLSFYSEMIDDLTDEALTEEDAVKRIGPVDEVISQIIADAPLSRLVAEKIMPKRTLKAWEIVLLVLGSPIWLSLSIAAFAVILSVYIVIWAVLIALWAVEAALVITALGSVAAGLLFVIKGEGVQGAAVLSAGIVLAGLSILLFFGCRTISKGCLLLTKKIALGIKCRIIGKGSER